jgi:hypothetical protein
MPLYEAAAEVAAEPRKSFWMESSNVKSQPVCARHFLRTNRAGQSCFINMISEDVLLNSRKALERCFSITIASRTFEMSKTVSVVVFDVLFPRGFAVFNLFLNSCVNKIINL